MTDFFLISVTFKMGVAAAEIDFYGIAIYVP